MKTKKSCTAYVYDFQYDDKVPSYVSDFITERGRGQNTYFKFHPCDGHFKPLKEVKDPSKIVRYGDDDTNYVYEIGDHKISDFFLKKGFKPTDTIYCLCWW
jgi:hypothetical protein